MESPMFYKSQSIIVDDLEENFKKYETYLSLVKTRQFNIHEYARQAPRKNALSILASKILSDAQLQHMVRPIEMEAFMAKITNVYV